MNQFFSSRPDLLAEAFGTMILVGVGTSAVTAISISGEATSASVLLVSALSFGLTLALLITFLGQVSGGHFNPAVSIGATISGTLRWQKLPFYLIAQSSGALLASVIVALCYGAPGIDAGLGATYPVTHMGNTAALAAEIIGTAILMTGVIQSAKLYGKNMGIQGAVIGSSLAIGILLAAGISGGALNPARAIAPQLATATYTGWWIYLLGPIIGAAGIAIISKIFTSSTEATSEAPEQPTNSASENQVAATDLTTPTAVAETFNQSPQQAAQQYPIESWSTEDLQDQALQQKAEEARLRLLARAQSRQMPTPHATYEPSFTANQAPPTPPSQPVAETQEESPKATPDTAAVRFVNFDRPIHE